MWWVLYLHDRLLYLGELSIILGDKQRLITSFITFTGRCGGYYTSMNDSFSSPNYPSPYPHHSRCDYTIMVPEGYSITLTFTDFHVKADFDFVWVMFT